MREAYRPIWENASIRTLKRSSSTPVKGTLYISRMMRIATDTAKPAERTVMKMAAFGGAKSGYNEWH
jgi:hypothetical protein